MYEMKNSLDGINGRLDLTEEKKKKKTLSEQWGNFKQPNIYINGVFTAEKRMQGQKGI